MVVLVPRSVVVLVVLVVLVDPVEGAAAAVPEEGAILVIRAIPDSITMKTG